MKIILLKNGKECLVDEEDFGKMSLSNWCEHPKGGYAYRRIGRNGSGGYIWMHREVLSAPKDKLVDHINHNPLDNRKSNLRLCDFSQNMSNSRKTKLFRNCNFKGVSYSHRIKKPFRAKLTLNRKHICLGHFKTETEAAIAYNNAAIKCFGEFACLNIIEQ